MSTVAVLLGLLVVAYVGSQLMGRRGDRLRFASGVEYLVLGVALGPYALGAAERSTLHAFQPLAVIGTAWITLVIGVGYGVQEGRRVSLRGLVTGVGLALFAASTVSAAVYAALRTLSPEAESSFIIAGGAGLVACETTRHAIRWVIGRNEARGPLTRLIGEVAECDELVPLAGISILFPLVDPPAVASRLPVWGWQALTPVLGVLLGATAAALLRAEPRASDGWGVVIGATLLGTGIASRLGLAPQAVTFAIGISLAVLSRHRAELRAMLGRSEEAVLLPILMLSGAELEVRDPAPLIGVLAAALSARLLTRAFSAPLLTALAGAPKGTSPSLALGLMPSGGLSATLGLAFESRFPGPIGDTVLAVAFGLAIVGELVGPAALRRALAKAGEVVAGDTAPDGASPTPVPEAPA